MVIDIPINSRTVTYAGIIGIGIAIIVTFGWKPFLLVILSIGIVFIIRKLEKKGINIFNTEKLKNWLSGKHTEKMNRKYLKYKSLANQKKNKW